MDKNGGLIDLVLYITG